MQESSAEIDKWLLAFFDVQQALEVVPRSSTNPFFNSKYAPLDVVWEAARQPLKDNSMAVLQTVTTTSAGGTGLRTTLLHTSGQWVSDLMPLLTVQISKDGHSVQTPQIQASAITYARRYALVTMLGMQTGEDDDGNLASTPAAAARNGAVDWVKLLNFAKVQGWEGEHVKQFIKEERAKGGNTDEAIMKLGMEIFKAAPREIKI